MTIATLAFRASPRSLRAYRVGCGALVAAGLCHLIAHVAVVVPGLAAQDASAAHAMAARHFVFAGLTRTMLGAYVGFSLAVVLFGVSTGLALWTAVDARTCVDRVPPRLAAVGVATALAGLAVAVCYFPVPAIALFGLGAGSFAVACVPQRESRGVEAE